MSTAYKRRKKDLSREERMETKCANGGFSPYAVNDRVRKVNINNRRVAKYLRDNPEAGAQYQKMVDEANKKEKDAAE